MIMIKLNNKAVDEHISKYCQLMSGIIHPSILPFGWAFISQRKVKHHSRMGLLQRGKHKMSNKATGCYHHTAFLILQCRKNINVSIFCSVGEHFLGLTQLGSHSCSSQNPVRIQSEQVILVPVILVPVSSQFNVRGFSEHCELKHRAT